MNYREEIETALHRDGKQYGKVWRDETKGTYIPEQLKFRKTIKTNRLMGFNKNHIK